MKKIYMIMAIGLMANFANAQRVAIAPEMVPQMAEDDDQGVVLNPSNGRSTRATVRWREDFANAIPIGSNPDVFSLMWGTWVSAGPHHLWAPDTDGPNGQFSTNIGALASTTSANGFLIFDSDGANPSVPYTEYSGVLTSPTINPTIWAGVNLNDTIFLRIEHRHRFCCDGSAMEIKVEVRNGTASWYPYDMTAGGDVNNATPNPTISTFALCDIPYPLTNDLQMRFTWGGTGVSHYFWMIDDIELLTADENDLAMIESFHGDFVNDWDYEIFPEMEVRPIRVAASVTNVGSTSQDSTILDIEITDPSNNVDNYSSTPAAWGGCNFKDTIWVDGFVPDEKGQYLIAYSVRNGSLMDDSDYNNRDTMTIDVSDTVFARDFGIYSNGGSMGAFDDANGNGVTAIVANQFTFVGGNNAHVKGLMTGIDNNTHVGMIIWPSIWEFPAGATSFNNDWIFIADGIEHTIAANEISDSPQVGGEPIWVNLYFDEPVPVPNSDSRYAVGVTIPAPDDTVRIPTSGVSIDFGAAIYGDLSSTPGSESWFNAYSNSRFDIPMIRAIMDYSVGLEELKDMGFDLSSNFPNPFSDRTAFTLNLKKSSNVSFSVMDIAGKVVYREEMGVLYSGRHQIMVDGRNFETGIYNFQLIVDDAKIGRRIVYTTY